MADLSSQAEYGKQELKKFQELFTPKLNDYIQAQDNYIKSNYSSKHLQKVQDFIVDYEWPGGKKLRPSLTYFTYKLFGGLDHDTALLLSLIIELNHNYIIMVDDFMDQSEQRHEKPTMHQNLASYLKGSEFADGNQYQLADALAVNAAVSILHSSMALMSELKVDGSILRSLLSLLNKNIEVTAYGQMLDVIDGIDKEVSESTIMEMLRLKTGVYTYRNPIHCGAILAGVTDQKTLDQLEAFAIPAGIAFQIWDDVLGMFGNPTETGKSAMDDLREGKYTLLVHYALQHGTPEQVAVLQKHLGNRGVSEAEHAEVKKVITQTGSYQYSKNKAQELISQAHKALELAKKPEWDQEAYNYLLGISKYTIERSK